MDNDRLYKAIMDCAREDERIRAVVLQGSRANPNAKRDAFQDWDIVYVVKETRSFRQTPGWIDRFGKRAVSQRPEEMDFLEGQKVDLDACYGYLLQFEDGTRLDLHLQSRELTLRELKEDRQQAVLLDKDGNLPHDAATDAQYNIQRPTVFAFQRACNQFWWLLPYVAKGLTRDELFFAVDHMNAYVLMELRRLLRWKVGLATGFSLSTGKNDKYLKGYLSQEDWARLLACLPASTVEGNWQALENAAALFAEVAREVASAFAYPYDTEEERGSLSVCRWYREQ